jgi:hypothetical protein
VRDFRTIFLRELPRIVLPVISKGGPILFVTLLEALGTPAVHCWLREKLLCYSYLQRGTEESRGTVILLVE